MENSRKLQEGFFVVVAVNVQFCLERGNSGN